MEKIDEIIAKRVEGEDLEVCSLVPSILRDDRQLGGLLTKCLSCLKEFRSFTYSDICGHYQYRAHPETSHKCSYCGGDVHFYQQEDKNPEPYHYCSPPKQTKTKNK